MHLSRIQDTLRKYLSCNTFCALEADGLTPGFNEVHCERLLHVHSVFPSSFLRLGHADLHPPQKSRSLLNHLKNIKQYTHSYGMCVLLRSDLIVSYRLVHPPKCHQLQCGKCSESSKYRDTIREVGYLSMYNKYQHSKHI